MAFQFENLQIWEKALNLTEVINRIASRFPKNEEFILGAQIRRAADSAALNIAEGSQGQSKAEFRRFLGIALRSCIEVVACIFIARKRNIISEDDFKEVYESEEQLVKMIQSLRNKL